MKKPLLITFFLLLSFTYTLSQKLECGFIETPCSAFAKANAVFVGKVNKVIQPSLEIWMRDKDFDQKATVTVEKLYKGSVPNKIILSQLAKDAAPKFIENTSYLFYANYDKKQNIWKVKPCTRTHALEFVNDDLLFLDGLPSSSGKTRVSGEVVYSSDLKPDSEHLRLYGFKVKIIGADKEYEATTDKNGIYEIYGLPPGKYVIRLNLPADKEFYGAMHSVTDPLSQAKDLSFELKEGGCISIDIFLTKRESKERIGKQ